MVITPELERLARTSAGRKWESRLRAALWVEQEAKCHWCSRETLLPFQVGYRRGSGSLSGKAATLDHLYSRLHPLYRKPVDHERYVMACNTCNGQRSKRECVAQHQQKLKEQHEESLRLARGASRFEPARS